MYGLFGTITAAPGRRDDLVAHLLRAAETVRDGHPDCLVYTIATTDQPDDVAVFEVWTSQDAHDASLQDPAVLALIGDVRPLVTGMSEGLRLEVHGGVGVSPPAAG